MSSVDVSSCSMSSVAAIQATRSAPLLYAVQTAAWKVFDGMSAQTTLSISSSSSYSTQTHVQPSIPSAPRLSPSAATTTSTNREIHRLLRSGYLLDASHLFDEMPHRDVVSWNTIIAGYARAGSPFQAASLFRDMLASGIQENPHTLPPLLATCSHALGRQLHCRAVSLGYDSNPFIGSATVDLYMRTGLPDTALAIFYRLPQRTTAACNSILRGCCELGLTDELLGFYISEMRTEGGVEPDGVSFSYLIRGCCCGPRMVEGRQLHCHVVNAGWAPSNMFLLNALVDLYSAAGELVDAMRAFDCIPTCDVISWNSIVSVCADNGSSIKAASFFHRMLWHNKKPSVRSFVALLNLSSRSYNFRLGLQIHGFVLKTGFDYSSVYVQLAMIDMYGKCFNIDGAVLFFNEIPERGIECCNSLITAFLHCNLVADVVEMFGLMIDEGLRPDQVSVSVALKALTSLASCQMLHCYAVKSGLDSDEAVSCSLIDGYARSGRCNLSRRVFESMEDPNLISYTACIAALARNGKACEGMELLDQMIWKGMKPDSVTLLCILMGCDHAGLVEEGRSVLASMKAVHGVEPDRRHYACMASLLGRAGLVEQAMELARSHCDPRMWSSLLHNCIVHGNAEIGRRAAEALMELQPGSAAACLQVSRFYHEIADEEGSARVRVMLQDCSGKEMGCSSVEVQSIITHL